MNVAGDREQVEIHLKRSDEDGYSLVNTLVVEMKRHDDPHQLFAYLCSLIIIFFPGMLKFVTQTFSGLGVPLYQLDSNSSRASAGMDMQPAIKPADAVAYLGQALFLLYKNIQLATYVNFMTKRIKAMADYVIGSNDEIPIILPFDKAVKLKPIIRSRHSFLLKKNLMASVMVTASKDSNMLSTLCGHVQIRLEYADMTVMKFIGDTLVVTRSPVLKHPSVSDEVEKMEEALRQIKSFEYPEHFMLLNPPEVTV